MMCPRTTLDQVAAQRWPAQPYFRRIAADARSRRSRQASVQTAMRAVRGSFPIWVKVMADSPSARGAFHEDSRALRGVEGQRLQKLLGGNMVLVSPERTPAERQRVAFEAAEQEASTREPAHVVGADDDAREIPDRIRDASFEPQDVPLRGPARMVPAPHT